MSLEERFRTLLTAVMDADKVTNNPEIRSLMQVIVELAECTRDVSDNVRYFHRIADQCAEFLHQEAKVTRDDLSSERINSFLNSLFHRAVL